MKPLVLVVLDGWGLREERDANAIALARTPVYTELLDRFPHASLVTSGEAVGLPVGQMGNSEVGHMNLGAGRIVYQDLTRIDKSIADGEFFERPALVAAMDRAIARSRALHLIGLVSDGGVHSHQRHLHALIRMAARRRVPRVFVHAITDGRDSSPTGGAGFVGELERVMAHEGVGRIVTVSGRYYAMDRDHRWERTRRAYEATAAGHDENPAATSFSAVDIIERAYVAGVTDEFIEPAVVRKADGSPVAVLEPDDSVVFFNFRADRARQLTRALAFDDFAGFERRRYSKSALTTMTVYDATFNLPVVFEPQTFSGNVADVLTARGLTNLRLAETEKYAHVTYFFNCGEERPYHGEDRVLIPSPKVATYDLLPQMSAEGITT
jgi:2,3-bisphosphoglycerate-independent phosphoglycerate mutase